MLLSLKVSQVAVDKARTKTRSLTGGLGHGSGGLACDVPVKLMGATVLSLLGESAQARG